MATSDDNLARLQQLADKKDPQSMFELAQLLEHGAPGITVNVRAAARYYRRAAEFGHVQSMMLIAKCCLLGKGVAQDPEEAFRWYSIAAEKGETVAQKNVSEMFLFGRGVEQNKERAEYWRKRAES